MDAQELNLLAHIDDAAHSAERIAAGTATWLGGMVRGENLADQMLVSAMGARAEDLCVMLRREVERRNTGVGGLFGAELVRLATVYFADALTSGAEVGMTTDNWDLEWLPAGNDANVGELEQERDAALAQIAKAKAQIADLLAQAAAQSEFVRQETESTRREKLRNRLGLSE